jgi:hypothetical protein
MSPGAGARPILENSTACQKSMPIYCVALCSFLVAVVVAGVGVALRVFPLVGQRTSAICWLFVLG